MAKLLVLGSNGQVGWELMRALQPLDKVKGSDRAVVDLSQPGEAARWVDYMRPDVVINAAAQTAVDRIERDPAAAEVVNATAVGAIAETCRQRGALLVHYSTDYVFDGLSPTPYKEDAATRPLNAYGRSKLQGDELVRASGCRHLILRIGGVYSLRRSNFLLAVIARAKSGHDLKVVADQVTAPTPAWLIADITAHLLHARSRDPALAEIDGVLNVGCSGSTSWYGFAASIFEALTAKPAMQERFRLDRYPCLAAIGSDEYASAAARPPRAVLDLGVLRERWKLSPPSWETALAVTLRDA